MDTATLGRMIALANADGEFQVHARFWTGSLQIADETHRFQIPVERGRLAWPGVADGASGEPGHVVLEAPAEVWQQVLLPVPPPPYADVSSAAIVGLRILGHDESGFQYRAALRRLLELLRHAHNHSDPRPQTIPQPNRHGQLDKTVGRYIHLDLGGHDHRVYFEEAGAGIPLVLQHTAGADSRQWRHVLEDDEITSMFRVISYDLPMHGKSLPPPSRAWWAEEYRLTRDFLMSVPVTLSRALGLDRPVFMGSSIGGHLAVDLAYYHPDDFRAVVGVEAAIAMPTPDLSFLDWYFHPKVSNNYKAATMIGITSPTAPEAYRQETGLVYSMGAPPVFKGDIYYYLVDHDLRGLVQDIDTTKVAVHLLTGEYDYASTPVMSQELANEIKGATYQTMTGLGHFPMCEDPDRFMSYVKPILRSIATGA